MKVEVTPGALPPYVMQGRSYILGCAFCSSDFQPLVSSSLDGSGGGRGGRGGSLGANNDSRGGGRGSALRGEKVLYGQLTYIWFFFHSGRGASLGRATGRGGGGGSYGEGGDDDSGFGSGRGGRGARGRGGQAGRGATTAKRARGSGARGGARATAAAVTSPAGDLDDDALEAARVVEGLDWDDFDGDDDGTEQAPPHRAASSAPHAGGPATAAAAGGMMCYCGLPARMATVSKAESPNIGAAVGKGEFFVSRRQFFLRSPILRLRQGARGAGQMQLLPIR